MPGFLKGIFLYSHHLTVVLSGDQPEAKLSLDLREVVSSATITRRAIRKRRFWLFYRFDRKIRKY